ncbi:uncharacterized protein PV07_00653 [Cladophialophora immunda]|uniref:Aminotransferase class V domain-containing protein n=1 Tax=Cladophialophora immunda TaxID=569365 RepID=A0A0D2DDP8_9EURO|nr:uncharacterized protein PV07_00653 [Cladophialophora immunda]KIW33834.1 hypothetical protein PV07_00653 [Cladophialophora immunda]OQU94349.1 hypothetical protein CLAIMM_00710 [Cladophialophora immunda]
MASLENKVIAITGGASGIGLATAKLLAERGAIVSLADTNQAGLDDALKALPGTERKHSAVIVDVRDGKQVDSWIEQIVSEHGRLDGAANVAGILVGGHVPISEETDEGWNRTMDVNAKGVFNCLRAQLRIMNAGASINMDKLTMKPAVLAACNGEGAHDNLARTEFGKPMRDKYFLFAKDYTNLNHGSFGGYPSTVQKALRHYQEAAEAEPDKFIRYTYPRLLRKSRALLAEMLHCPVDELVLCSNVTTATNTVLQNLRWEEGDKIVYTSGVYGALEKTIEYIVETTPAESVRVELDLPQSDDKIVELFRKTLTEEKLKCEQAGKGRVRLGIFDSIVSMPGLRVPFERLVQLCRQEGVLSLVDAAHGVGHIALDLTELDPDFLVTNCHKWLFVPRSVAAFFVPKRNQHLIHTTLPTSHGFQPQRTSTIHDPMPTSDETNPMVKQFEYFGTIDGAAYCCIEEAIRFRNEVCGGEAAARAYCTSLAKKAEEILVETLGTDTFDIPETHRVFFAHVRLPISVGQGAGYDVPAGDASAIIEFMNKEFVERYGTFFFLLFYRGAWWARLSATVYLDLEDCKYAAFVLKDLSERVCRREYRAVSPGVAER